MGLVQKKLEENGVTFKMRSFNICHGIWWRDWGKSQTILVRIADVLAQTWMELTIFSTYFCLQTHKSVSDVLFSYTCYLHYSSHKIYVVLSLLEYFRIPSVNRSSFQVCTTLTVNLLITDLSNKKRSISNKQWNIRSRISTAVWRLSLASPPFSLYSISSSQIT